MAKKVRKHTKVAKSTGHILGKGHTDNSRALIAIFSLAVIFVEYYLFMKFNDYVLQNTFHAFMIFLVAQIALVVYLLHLISKK